MHRKMVFFCCMLICFSISYPKTFAQTGKETSNTQKPSESDQKILELKLFELFNTVFQTYNAVVKEKTADKQLSKKEEVAAEYIKREDFQKAEGMYEELLKDDDVIPSVYQNYVLCLARSGKIKPLEKFIKKANRKFPERLEFLLTSYHFYKFQNESKEADKVLKSLVSYIKNKPEQVLRAGNFEFRLGQTDLAAMFYQESRKALQNNSFYLIELSTIYKAQGKTDFLIEELLNYALYDPAMLGNTEQIFQNLLTEKKDFDLLETKLIEKATKDPQQSLYNELLYWLYVQQKDFSGAFIQAKALDKRQQTDGMKILELGSLCMTNKDFASAIDVYSYFVQEFKNSQQYFYGFKSLINAREEIIKNQYPVPAKEVQALVREYKSMLAGTRNPSLNQEIRKNMASLLALYLGRTDTAITVLENLIKEPRYDPQLYARVKLDLGDYYLLNGEPWEATLIYSQVEKDEKDAPLGHEAKLRNARLFYFKGEFELAKEHLDILKMATTREISNDAMDLSLLIQDNLALDTTGKPLKAYSRAELLLFQNKETEAIVILDSLLKAFPGPGLSDEIYFLKYRIFSKTKEFNKALEQLNLVITNSKDGIYGDDAVFFSGQLWEEKLNDKNKAMEFYQELMKAFPGSVYVAEARKRFRILRGDKIN